MMVALTPAFEELTACARAFSVFADGVMVVLVPFTLSVKLPDVLIDVVAGSATVGSVALLSVVVDEPGLVMVI